MSAIVIRNVKVTQKQKPLANLCGNPGSSAMLPILLVRMHALGLLAVVDGLNIKRRNTVSSWPPI